MSGPAPLFLGRARMRPFATCANLACESVRSYLRAYHKILIQFCFLAHSHGCKCNRHVVQEGHTGRFAWEIRSACLAFWEWEDMSSRPVALCRYRCPPWAFPP